MGQLRVRQPCDDLENENYHENEGVMGISDEPTENPVDLFKMKLLNFKRKGTKSPIIFRYLT